MDWGRAKTILILSFLILNILLAFQLVTSRADLLEFEANNSGVAEELQKLVKLKNIQVPADIPKDVPKLREIVVKFDESLAVDAPKPLAAPLRFDPLINRSGFKDMLAKTGIPRTEAYEYDPVGSTGGTYVFQQMYGRLPMFDVQLKLVEQGGLVGSYTQSYVEVQPQGEGGGVKEQKVITAYIALRRLIENYLPNGSVIRGVQLGYHEQISNSQTRNMWPSWRVSLGNGLTYYVHALNGAVEEPLNPKSRQ
ncbi:MULTISPECIES: two-component system regulatory protein YycI [Paenibacillus]|uniref:two-component system regulatory protein YycI n=1 Tax=Paenibacillus TaxID=44249 RepID=UPI0022B8A6A5|nr:two-component system regulatory protein YycI [Paenibacillus caseinilyticus]MCZ8524061.1 two-component system regulatory protein YycI [Paenibacillus caseinilyticus]